MSIKDPPSHVRNLFDNLKEVQRLIDIHMQIAGAQPGFKHKVEVLNKSAIVLLLACWEAYIEDLVVAAFEFMMENAKDHTVFPDSVLTLSSKKLKSADDGRLVWQLAGNGWMKVLKDHKEKTVSEYTAHFNTPKWENIDKLFKDLVGFTTLSNQWHWRGRSVDSSRKMINELVSLRGSIAHRVAAARSVYKEDVTSFLWLIYHLAVISHNKVCHYVGDRTSKLPWEVYKFRDVL